MRSTSALSDWLATGSNLCSREEFRNAPWKCYGEPRGMDWTYCGRRRSRFHRMRNGSVATLK